MEITIGSVKLRAEDCGGARGDTYILIDIQADFSGDAKPIPKVKASELKAAIEALEKTCWRT